MTISISTSAPIPMYISTSRATHPPGTSASGHYSDTIRDRRVSGHLCAWLETTRTAEPASEHVAGPDFRGRRAGHDTASANRALQPCARAIVLADCRACASVAVHRVRERLVERKRKDLLAVLRLGVTHTFAACSAVSDPIFSLGLSRWTGQPKPWTRGKSRNVGTMKRWYK
jgi:hypothetical protein